MKKLGYTLQEVLIAMAAIGVVAALTIPMITAGSRNQALATKLAATVSDFENGLTTMIVREAAEDLTETEWYQNDCEAEDLVDSYKMQGFYNSGESGTYEGTSKENGKNSKLYKVDYNIAYQANNGALIFIKKEVNPVVREGIGTYLGRIYFDVNGEEKPNRAGRDIFGYVFTETGHLYPIGSEKASLLVQNNYDNVWTKGSCEDGNITVGCTARLAEKGYKVDY